MNKNTLELLKPYICQAAKDFADRHLPMTSEVFEVAWDAISPSLSIEGFGIGKMSPFVRPQLAKLGFGAGHEASLVPLLSYIANHCCPV